MWGSRAPRAERPGDAGSPRVVGYRRLQLLLRRSRPLAPAVPVPRPDPMFVRRAAALLLPLACAACLAGPATALGGGPIGRAPNLRAAELLRVPDSTRGVGFVIAANRRDLLEESRVELNAAARSFERLLGARPTDADIRLTADEREVRASIRVGSHPPSSFTIALAGARGSRLPEPMRVASIVVLATAREWLVDVMHELVPGDTSSLGWMAREQVPAWLRTGLLQNVAVHPLHELWMAQLGRQRESLPTVASLFAREACDGACLAPFLRIGSPGSATEGDAMLGGADGDAAPGGGRGARRGGALPGLQGPARYAASTLSLVQFMARREGPTFMRRLMATALEGGDVTAALGSATSFTADPGDIDRQWRVWLATFAFPDGR